MKHTLLLFVATLSLSISQAQEKIEEITLKDGTVIKVDRSVFPEFDPNQTLAAPPADYIARRKAREEGKAPKIELPPYVYNGEDKYFPPIFNQDGGSCGSAQSIGYMFTHEMNSYRDLDSSLPENQYPTHFTWLLAYQTTSTEGMASSLGIPNVPTYGGRTYSKLFGPQTHDDPDYGWMQGYDKWYSAMWNKTLQSIGFSATNTPEGRQELKEWLFNHSGDTEMHGGGVAGIGVAAYGDWASIPTSAANRDAGVVGMKYVRSWGDVFNHAVTVCGYDDRIEFDLDGDGKIGEADEDEVGAWIIANSWGDGWENNGFIYCPYKYSYAVGKDQSPWSPGTHIIRKDYRPLRTIKLLMEYSRRSEMLLQAGVSENLNATKPDAVIPFEHFRNAGNTKGASPAPEVPMLGRWADGMHYEPMEFGYDLTALTSTCDRTKPLKYFFIVKTSAGAIGSGLIHKASIINYEVDNEGVEIPFPQSNVDIKNNGAETIISVVVPGEQLYPATNLTLADGVLVWTEPQTSSLKLLGYHIYDGSQLVATLPKGQTHYVPQSGQTGPFSVCAYYQTGKYQQESKPTNSVALEFPQYDGNDVAVLSQSGITIPNAVTESLSKATIEFWLRPSSISSYIQQVGPGWGTFLFHTDNSGRLYAGWNTGSDRYTSSSSTLLANRWSHIAIVIDGNVMTLYVNAVKKGSVTSKNYSGLAAFGDLKFGRGGSDSWMNGSLDEVRIWRSARTQTEIRNNMRLHIAQPSMHPDLLVYLPMETIEVDGSLRLREWVHGNHAIFQPLGTTVVSKDDTPLSGTVGTPALSIVSQEPSPKVGVPFTLVSTAPLNTTEWVWQIPDAREKTVYGSCPTVTFDHAGTFTATCTIATANEETVTASIELTVGEGSAPVAAFDILDADLPAGDRFSFVNRTVGDGCTYLWSMPGAEVEQYSGTNATALYPQTGTFEVTLTATNSQGSSSVTHTVTVRENAPASFFALSNDAILLGDTIQLLDQSRYSPLDWHWELSNGSRAFIVEEQSPAIVPKAPGVYDVSLRTTNALGENTLTKGRILTVANDDAKTALNFTGTERLQLECPFTEEQKTLTLDWWMRPQDYTGSVSFSSESAGLSTSVDAKGKLTITQGTKTTSSCDGYIVKGEWHHYAITYNIGSVSFYRDGILAYKSLSKLATRMPPLGTIIIGAQENGFRGQMDEVRLWSKAFTPDLILKYCNQHIKDVAAAEAEDLLILYYDFNQNGGDVQDRVSVPHNAVRIGFGPDGDAWNSSLGVFTLDTEAELHGDISDKFLTNYKNPFTTASGTVNPNNSSRFLKLAMKTTRSKWQDMNAIVSGNIITGAHIDTEHNKDITVETQWSGFASPLLDYRLWQTITLPAGKYSFCGHVSNGDAMDSRLVACVGKTMIADSECEEKALAWCKLNQGEISFNLYEETEVSLGIIVNMTGQSSFSLNYFMLNGQTFDFLTPIVADVIEIPCQNVNIHSGISHIYDISGRKVSRPEHGVYIIDNSKVMVK